MIVARARLVLPINGPPIENGALAVQGRKIVAVGRWPDLRRIVATEPVDLGEAAILPGLINAHCHLDYTAVAGKVGSYESFPDWIKGLLAYKAHWSYSEYADSWLSGAAMLLKNGVTTVADIEAAPELLPEVWTATPLRVVSLIEMTGVASGAEPREILRAATNRIATLPHGRCQAGLSPHAPYSTRPALLTMAAQWAREQRRPLAIHLAESVEEYNMFLNRRGALFDWLKPQRDMTDCGGVTPIEHVERCGGLCPELLAIHVNFLGRSDADLLARRGVSVVHCPRSHRFFRRPPFPRRRLESAGVNVALGTDSLASMDRRDGFALELNPFSEMCALLNEGGISPEAVLRMATVNGARAIGREKTLGHLSPGAKADWIAVGCRGPLRDPWETVVAGAEPMLGSMIDGVWALRPTEIGSSA